MPTRDELIPLHGRLLGLAADGTLLVESAKIASLDYSPIEFPDGVTVDGVAIGAGTVGIGTGIVTGGSVSRSNAARWPERGMLLTEVGVDCTGATDATTALQAAINAAPDESNLIVPQGAKIKLSSTININNRVGLRIISDQRPKNGGATDAPTFIWAASGGTAFSFFCCDHPGVEGFMFNGAYGNGMGCPDTWLLFDGTNGVGGGTKTPTQAMIHHCSFYMDAAHTGYKAIQISPTSNSNHEDYEISDCDFVGYQDASSTVRRATDGVTTHSATSLTSATAAFVSGDAGKKIIISCALGSLTTTVASVTNGTTVVLTNAWTLASQTGATIHIGQMYGTAIYQRGNNSFATRFRNLGVSYFATGLDLGGGSNGSIDNIGGGFNDVCISMDGGWDISRYDCEGDSCGILVPSSFTRPIYLRGLRIVLTNQRADGWFNFNAYCNAIINGSMIDQGPPATNSMLFSNYGGGANVVSINNIYGNGGGGYSRSGNPAYGPKATNITNWISLADTFAEGWNSVQTIFNNLPVSDPVLPGSIWSDGGVLVESGSVAPSTYLGLPQNAQNAGYTCVLGDAGKSILMETAGTFTIPANAVVPYPLGTVLTFINNTTTCTIPITSDTMTLAGTATTGTRTLAANGLATAIKITTTGWLISGTGLT